MAVARRQLGEMREKADDEAGRKEHEIKALKDEIARMKSAGQV